MTRSASLPLPSVSALLSGIPAHLLDEDALTLSLRRMGLSPGFPFVTEYAGVAAREWAVTAGQSPMRVIRIEPDALMAKALSGRYPGSEGRDFVPEGRVLILCWHEAALRMPDGNLDSILTTLALVSAFLYPRLIQWCPASLWSDAPNLTRGIEKYLGGGALPVLHLVGFARTGKRKSARITTRGLAIFTGQELSAEASHMGAAETVRRLARLILDMFNHGPVLRSATIDGLMPGETITLNLKSERDRHDLVDIAISGG